MILRYWHYILLFVSLFSIGIALIAEFFYGLQPCELCLKQRHPYYLFILLILFIFFIPILHKIFIYTIVQIGALYGIFYSLWHVGVENKLIMGPSSCSAGLLISESTIDLKKQILKKEVISCEEVIWSFFGISAASLNAILLLFIFVINALYIYRIWKRKKK